MLTCSQDELRTDLCLSDLNTDFLDTVLLDGDMVPSLASADIHPAVDVHHTDHMYSRSSTDSASDVQPCFSPLSVCSHASLYSHGSGSHTSLLENGSSLATSECCTSPLDVVTEDLTVQSLLAPAAVDMQGSDIIHIISGGETVTDDTGLISVGKLYFFRQIKL